MQACRPFGCSDPKCSYFTIGFRNEKERDEHIAMEHNAKSPTYQCPVAGCTYTTRVATPCDKHIDLPPQLTLVERSKSNVGTQLSAEEVAHTPNLAVLNHHHPTTQPPSQKRSITWTCPDCGEEFEGSGDLA